MNNPKIINRHYAGTKERIDAFLELYSDAIKIEDAEVYWCDSEGIIGIFTTEEYKDYLVGKSELNFKR